MAKFGFKFMAIKYLGTALMQPIAEPPATYYVDVVKHCGNWLAWSPILGAWVMISQDRSLTIACSPRDIIMRCSRLTINICIKNTIPGCRICRSSFLIKGSSIQVGGNTAPME